MKVAPKITVKRINKNPHPNPTRANRQKPRHWYQRKSNGETPWFIMPIFNNLHPLEVLRSRIRYWEEADKVYPHLHREEKKLAARALLPLAEDLRWLASRLETMIEEGYTSVAD